MPVYIVRSGFMLGGKYGNVSVGDRLELTEKEAAPHLFASRIAVAEEPEETPAPATVKKTPKTSGS